MGKVSIVRTDEGLEKSIARAIDLIGGPDKPNMEEIRAKFPSRRQRPRHQ